MVSLVLFALVAHPAFDEGQRAFEALDFRKASAELRRAVDDTSTLEEKCRALDLLAQSLLALGREEEAQQTFLNLLSIDPHFPNPSAAPKVVGVFLQVKQRLYPPPSVQIVEKASEKASAMVTVVDPWHLVADVRLVSAAGDEQRQKLERGAALKVDAGQRLEALGSTNLLLAKWSLPLLSPTLASATAQPSINTVERAGRPKTAGWIVVGVSAAVALAGGLLLASSFSDAGAGAQGRTASELSRANNDIRNRATWGNGLVAAGAVGLSTGAVLLVW
jgi:tetratricopeptide (TPR) repeat protein